MSTISTKLITAEEFFEMADAGRSELVRGEIVPMAPPPGAEHGRAAFKIGYRVGAFVLERRLGEVFAAETGFTIARDPDVVRAADVAFVRAERMPAGMLHGYISGSPDLVVEVASPSDRLTDMLEKVDQWLSGGAISVWLVDPSRRSIDIYRAAGQVLRYHENDTVTDEPALPGFALQIRDIF